ncbi:MAG: hypothetical protein COT81_01460 [Candidatus Buchananbacteria bacterium CG10_big_fil_rev_8_21_14_0_10_42_9]|uniref:MarR family transcriptional regulator n=1 Tax=Candidatus Buchananbacteria bacterium CG10_big_fil_rev_8_21_14_0_10_42_9 TaxID=1974526 RepID=A0A2H0W236_9BACT|nr:MAG: hypothetical protein COT81_01460 [Candidatus Buchananbacteria bacterium CG10_big_fil_rev_8_21_14_0_10_42_9]
MQLSALQKYILKQCAGKTKVTRDVFLQFYKGQKSTKSKVNDITRSLERLIDKKLMVGFGRRTPQKWFIESVRLTSAGKKAAKSLFGQQQKLPFKKLRKK